jgi:hypothetical protein
VREASVIDEVVPVARNRQMLGQHRSACARMRWRERRPNLQWPTLHDLDGQRDDPNETSRCSASLPWLSSKSSTCSAELNLFSKTSPRDR